jgi:hypothetical protein
MVENVEEDLTVTGMKKVSSWLLRLPVMIVTSQIFEQETQMVNDQNTGSKIRIKFIHIYNGKFKGHLMLMRLCHS